MEFRDAQVGGAAAAGGCCSDRQLLGLALVGLPRARPVLPVRSGEGVPAYTGSAARGAFRRLETEGAEPASEPFARR